MEQSLETGTVFYGETRKRRGLFGRLVFGILFVLMTAATAVLALKYAERPVIYVSALPQKVDELNFITFRDQILLVDKAVPLNPYDRASFSYDGERLNYDDGAVKGIFGVDVSWAQNEIDWQRAKADGVEFAMLRTGYRGYSEGGIVLDNQFEMNIEGAPAAGVDVGLYFFSQAITPDEAREEARWVLDLIGGHPVSYPIVFDWEFYSGIPDARSNGMDRETLTACAAAFCAVIEEAGYTPMIYFNMSLGYLYYDLNVLKGYDFWLAELDEPPVFHYGFQMLQYSHGGTVDGIEGPVDLNLSFIDYAN